MSLIEDSIRGLSLDQSKSGDNLKRVQEIIPELTEDNAISLSFGLKFKLIQVFQNGNKTEVTLMKSSEDNTFFGLFDVEDIDFEILIDNQSNDKKISLNLDLTNRSADTFIVGKGIKTSLKALETNGKHLHFLSQGTDDGKSLVSMSAKHKQISYSEAAIKCSRIGFSVEIERKRKKKAFVIDGPQIEIDLKFICQNKTVKLTIGLNNTIGDMKVLLNREERLCKTGLFLLFGAHQLRDNNRQLNSYNIENGSIIYVSNRFRGGGTGPDPQNSGLGERGVVCFGGKTKAKFRPYLGHFISSNEFKIKAFTIELRMKSKYSLN